MSSPLARRRWRKRARQAGAAPPPPAEVAKVKELLAALDKVDRTAPLYPKGSTIRQGFVGDLHRKLARLLGEVHALELVVGPDEIEYQGEVVYDGSKSDRSLSFALDDGGVRRLAFVEGVREDEVTAFVECLEEARAASADDLVNLLWARELEHVSYVSVDVFDDPAAAAASGLDLEAQGRALIDRLRGQKLSIDQVAAVRRGRPRRGDGAAAGDGEDEDEDDGDGASGTGDAADLAALVLPIRPDEQDALARWVADERGRSPALAVSQLALALAASGEGDAEATRRRLQTLEQGVRALVEDGEVASAADLVVRARALAEPAARASRVSRRDGGGAASLGSALRSFLRAVATRDLGDRLARHLSRARGGQSIDAVLAFVRALGPGALALAPALTAVTDHAAALLDALAEATAGEPQLLRQEAAGPDPALAGLAVVLLGRALGDDALKDLLAAASHADASVRAEAMRALGRCRSPRALERLVEAVERDPAPPVRAAALRAFPAFIAAPAGELYARLLAQAEDAKGFDARPERDQVGLLVALARLDAERGLAYLEQLARGRFSLFGRARVERLRLRAVAALGEHGSARAEEILRALAERASAELGEACRAALHRVAAARRGGGGGGGAGGASSGGASASSRESATASASARARRSAP